MFVHSALLDLVVVSGAYGWCVGGYRPGGIVSRIIGDHAVVLGAGMAGLLTAGVVANAYGRVTVFDRDAMSEIGVHRRGVPQDRHLHFLHPRGRQALEELFPGLIARLIGEGLLPEMRWATFGGSCPGINFARRVSGCPVCGPADRFWRAISVPG